MKRAIEPLAHAPLHLDLDLDAPALNDAAQAWWRARAGPVAATR